VENEKINKNRAQCNIFRSLLIAFQRTQTHTHTYTYAHKNSQPAACQREDRKGVGGHSGDGGLWRRGRRGGRLYTTTSRYKRGGITLSVLHYRGRDGIPGDMGRGFARRRPFDFDFETIMRGVGGGKTQAVMARDDRRGNGAHQDGGHPGIVCSAEG